MFVFKYFTMGQKRKLKKSFQIKFADSLKTFFKEFEPQMGTRKFNRNIKKASKMFAADLKPLKKDQIHGEAPIANPTKVQVTENGHPN